VVLQSNNNNLKRTARETGIPENTIRRWRDAWKNDGPPVQEELSAATDSAVAEMEYVRNLALRAIRDKILAGEGKIGELNAVYGTITEKLVLLLGGPTSRVDHTVSLPSAEDLQAVLGAAVQGAIDKAARRQEEIIDAELIEPKALPRST